jgi:hypothetical protein
MDRRRFQRWKYWEPINVIHFGRDCVGRDKSLRVAPAGQAGLNFLMAGLRQFLFFLGGFAHE